MEQNRPAAEKESGEGRPLKGLRRTTRRVMDWKVSGKWFFLSAMIGVLSGLAAIVFELLCQGVVFISLHHFGGYSPVYPEGEFKQFVHTNTNIQPLAIVAVMTVGGLISGILCHFLAKEATGPGTDAVIDAFHFGRGRIRWRVPFVKMVGSAITLGTGGSAGREGPIAQIAAGFGSWVGHLLNLPSRDRRILLAAGMAAGVGAMFHAPLAGALLAAEIMYRDADLESDVIVPAAIASIIGYSTYSLGLPPEYRFTPLFGQALQFSITSPYELFPYALLALVVCLMGVIYTKAFEIIRALFARLKCPDFLKPAIGALLAGTLAMGVFELSHRNPHAMAALCTGYGTLQAAFDPEAGLAIGVLLMVVGLKIVTTALTIGSGAAGGVFGPSIVIGGCLGGATGLYLQTLMPDLVTQPQAYAVVGMAGFFAGCARAPISTIIMVSEMTGDYKLLLPTMWVSTICFLLMRPFSLYRKQLANPLESPAHHGDFIVDILEGIKVEEVYDKGRRLVMIPESMSLDEIVHQLTSTHQHYFPVVDQEGLMVGIFSSDDVRSYLYDETIWHLAVARDVMTWPFVSVAPEDNLSSVLRKFTAQNLDELPVMDSENPGKLLGMLRRKETIAFYNRRLMQLKESYSDD